MTKNLAILILLLLGWSQAQQRNNRLNRELLNATMKRRSHNVFQLRKSSRDTISPSPTPQGTVVLDAAVVTARKKSRGGAKNKGRERKSRSSKMKGGKGGTSMRRKSSKSKSNKSSKDSRMGDDDFVDDDLVQDATPMPTMLGTQAPTASPLAATSPAQGTPATPTTQAPVTAIQQAPAVLNQCVPTVGPCIDNENDLTNTLINLDAGDTVALCEGTINTTKALNIVTDNTVLCCDDNATAGCALQSTGTDRNLEVEASSFTSLGVTYRAGRSEESGGNIFISGSGNHQLTSSMFIGGETDATGGNAYIETDGSVLILSSTFADGMAAINGGGLVIDGASTVGVILSTFDDNEAPEGAGLFVTRGDANLVGQQILMEDSVFSNNNGVVGAGLMVSDLGNLPSLGILNTQFISNFAGPGTSSVGNVTGGVGASAMIFEPVSNLNLVLNGNSGSSNIATGANNFCAGLVILENDSPGSAQCLQPGSEFPV